jgi:hypothetical protein
VSEQHHEGFEPSRRAGVRDVAQGHALGKAEVEEGPMTVFIYVTTSKQMATAII